MESTENYKLIKKSINNNMNSIICFYLSLFLIMVYIIIQNIQIKSICKENSYNIEILNKKISYTNNEEIIKNNFLQNENIKKIEKLEFEYSK